MSGGTKARGPAAARRLGLRRFIKNEKGSTAIEFGLLAPPFIVIILGILAIALQFFTILMLEVGVETASRKLRTGAAQSSGMTMSGFKSAVCSATGGVINCGSDLSVLVASGSTFASLGSGPSCVSGGAMTASASDGTSMSSLTGSDGAAVMVTVCYTWSLGTSLWSQLKNFVSVAPLQNGKSILTARTMFRLEG